MELTKRIDSVFCRWDHPDTPGGQVLVKHHGKVIYDRCFGLANLEHHIPISPRPPAFMWHRCPNRSPSSVCCCLPNRARWIWMQHVRTYLPDLVHWKETVTVRNLMNNTSGIRDQWELFCLRGIHYTDTITMRDFEQTLRPQQTLNFQPGSRFLYSNSNFTMIAQIVHRISGMDLPDFAQQHIFTPLGMTHTCIRRGYWQMIPELALSYSDDGSGRFVPSALNFALWGATSMNTNVSDLMLLLEHYHHPRHLFAEDHRRDDELSDPCRRLAQRLRRRSVCP